MFSLACQPVAADTDRKAQADPDTAFVAADTAALLRISGPVRRGLADARFYARNPGASQEMDALELTSFTVRSTTSGASIRSHLDVEIHNTSKRQLEAVMRVPVPPGAAITKAVLYVGDTPMTGAFVQRQRARAIYDSIVSRRRDPLLAVWSGPDWLDITIFPVDGQSRRRFQLEWVEPIAGSASASHFSYRVPVLAHRGRVVGKPASLTIDGKRYRTSSASVRVNHRGSALVAARLPGDPFGYVALRPDGAPSGRANVVLLADTSARMTLAARKHQRRALSRLLAGFPENARISLLSADWLVDTLASASKTSEIRSRLSALDDIPSAGALDLGQALNAAIDEAVAIGAPTIVFLGLGQSTLSNRVPDEILTRLQDLDISIHMLAKGKISQQLQELAWLSGGQVLSDGHRTLGGLLRPRLATDASGDVSGDVPGDALANVRVERWYPLTSATGELLWLGRYVGNAPAGAAAGVAADLRSLWVRANLAADADPTVYAERPYQVITPFTSLLVLETEADYRRFGLKVPSAETDEPLQVARDSAGATRADRALLGQGQKTAGGDAVGDAALSGSIGSGASAGVGSGGGGTGMGTIGIGNYGTIGRGAGRGAGVGSGYGIGMGGLRGRRARVPRIRMGKAAVSGSLDKNIIRRVIRRHLRRIRYCYEKQLQVTPDLAGRISTKFIIGPDGRVVSAEVKGLGQPAVHKCVNRALRAMRFPRPPGGGTIHVSYPMVFRPGDGPASHYVPPPSKWARALKLLDQNKPLKALRKKQGALAGAPKTNSPALLGWWLVDKNLRNGYASGEAYVLAARLLHKGGQVRNARRILSESGQAFASGGEALYKRWRVPADARRLNQLIYGR